MEGVAGGVFEPDMPDAGPAAYLLAHFWAAGPTLGDQALTQGELWHYQENAGVTLSPWECQTLRLMSKSYINEQHNARTPACAPPFTESTDAQRLKQAELDRKMDVFLS